MDEKYMMPHQLELLVLSIGSNMGDRLANINRSIELLQKEVSQNLTRSKVYETEPWGNTNQDQFLNMAVILTSNMNPMVLLDTLLHIEQKIGRVRNQKWGPRLIDIDIIFYGNMIYKSDLLEIPHPYMSERKFVLEPLNELIPDFVHPSIGKSVSRLFSEIENE